MVQFRRSKKVGPFRLTLSKKGLSGSVGSGPFRIGIGADRKVRRTLRIPGTGIYDVKVVGQTQSRSTASAKPAHMKGVAMSNPPAGWYQDPSGQPRQRYWDGQKWTAAFNPPIEDTNPPVQNTEAKLPKNDGAQLIAWSSLREFVADEIPERFNVTYGLQKKLAELFDDPTQDTSGDSPLLAALAFAILNLETNMLLNLFNISTNLLSLSSAFNELDARFVRSGLPAALPTTEGVRRSLREAEYEVYWN